MNRRTVIIGLGLVVIGILVPSIVRVEWFRIFTKLALAVDRADQGLLILATTQAVLINTLRSIPHYLGAFIVSSEWYQVNRRLGLVTSLAILPLGYQAIYYLSGVRYGFMSTILLVILAMVMTSVMRAKIPSVTSRALVLILILFGAQWLEVMPMMGSLGRGGEISREVQRVAHLLQAEAAIDFIGFLFLGFSLVAAVLLVLLLIVHERELNQERQVREREQELQVMRIAVLEAKMLKEVRSLTHDLKTPLTAIQGLTSVLQLMLGARGDQADSICERISQAADSMNEMISDIVMQERRQPIDISDLLSFTAAQVSPQQGTCTITLNIEEDMPKIAGNRVRLSRAFANILENSLQALDYKGTIDISVKSLPDHRIRIVISDDGPGISESDKHRVFEFGYSTKGTPGLGLSFVEEVMRDHGGTMHLWSVAGVGTRVVIALPEVTEN